MTPDQTIDLLDLLAAANVLNRLDERTPDVWHAALGDLEYRDCMRAAADLIRTQQWVKIADIRQAVQRLRTDTARDIQGPGQPAAVPDADPDDVHAYLAAVREQRTQAACGEDLKPRPVLELLAGVGREVPAEDQPKPRGPMGVPCQHCGAKVRHPCQRSSSRNRMTGFHPVRIEDARRVEHGLAPVDRARQQADIQARIEASRRAAATDQPTDNAEGA